MAVRIAVIIIFISLLKCVLAANMSGHISGGQYSHIWQFPHSVYIIISCENVTVTCGASVLNQAILITAAHCVEMCSDPDIHTYSGNEHKTEGFMSPVSKVAIHKNYTPVIFSSDIALLRLKHELKLGYNIGKVLLLREPPYNQIAFIAGWGRVQPGRHESIYLKHISQTVYKREECGKIGVRDVPVGTICGQHWLKQGRPRGGDSGSALVLRNVQIQIGIASHTQFSASRTNIVYTDTGYFYDWIKENAEELYCESRCHLS